MKIFFRVISIFIFLPAFFYAHTKEKTFSIKIDGSIRNFAGKIIYIHHKWDDKDYTDSAIIEKGHFLFKLKSIDPNMYWFTTSREINAQPNAIFFADATPLNALLVGDSLASSIIEGGQTQKDYIAYKNSLAAFTQKQQKLQSDYTLAYQKGEADLAAKIQQDYQALNQQYIADLKNFIKAHPKSAVSGYIIFKEFSNPNIPVENAIECLAYLDKSIEHTKFARLANKKINDIKGTMVGAQATDFTENTPEGVSVRLSDYKGRYVLVDFWASWCRPCRMENPSVVAAYNRFKDKGFTVLSVSLDTSKEQWISAIGADHLTWTNISDLKGGNNEAAMLYGIANIPQNVLIDKDGKIIAKNLRGPALEEKLGEVIK